MESHAENNRRIAKNTLMLYVRMLFSMLVSLYTSRVVLNALGVEDYGIYNVVGGLVSMFAIISNSLSASVSRFLTFELGRGDMEKLKSVFSTSVLIHVALALVIFILAEGLGVWFLNAKMNIPPERMTAANWVFQASLVSFLFGLFSVPYNAAIIAHERMSAFAYIGILDVVLKLVIILFVAYVPLGFDKLIVYALLLMALSVFMRVLYQVYCRRHFEECRRLRWNFDRPLVREMGSFAGWNFIGSTAALLKEQGVNVLLNMFAGPVLNAARGVAFSVNSSITAFSGNFMTALNPQITKSYAVGERGYMFTLAERGARFSFYIILFFALPIILETECILTLWLKTVPEHAVNFVRLVLVLSLVDILSNTLITIQSATGKIRNYQIVVGGTLLLNFPLSYVCLKVGLPPESVYLVAIVVALACLVLRLLFLRGMVGLSMRRYLVNVCLRVFVVTLVAAAAPVALHLTMEYGWLRLVAVALVSIACTAISAYFLGCDAREKTFFREKGAKMLAKMRTGK